MTRALQEYRDKRDFTRTNEPSGDADGRAGTGQRHFVVQKHAARRLHWDFRLEWNGVLLSWAVTRGPSASPAAKRLARRFVNLAKADPRPAHGRGKHLDGDRDEGQAQLAFPDGACGHDGPPVLASRATGAFIFRRTWVRRS